MKKPTDDHKVIKVDRKLQAKTGSGDVDHISVKKAEHFLSSNKVVYADVVSPILVTLKAAIDALKKYPIDRDEHILK